MTTPSSARELAAAFLRIGETADRFDRDARLTAVLDDHRRSEDEVRRRDAAITRRLEAIALPLIAFAIGFVAACGI